MSSPHSTSCTTPSPLSAFEAAEPSPMSSESSCEHVEISEVGSSQPQSVQTTSRTWVAPEHRQRQQQQYQQRQQAFRVMRAAHIGQRQLQQSSQQPRQRLGQQLQRPPQRPPQHPEQQAEQQLAPAPAELQIFNAHRTDMKVMFPRSFLNDPTYPQWVDDQAEAADSHLAIARRKHSEREREAEAIALAKTTTNVSADLDAFKGKRFADEFAAVNPQRTIWRPGIGTGPAVTAEPTAWLWRAESGEDLGEAGTIWPDHRELSYDGTERLRDQERLERRFPIVRDWQSVITNRKQFAGNIDDKDWLRYRHLPPESGLDQLEAEKPRSHLDCYPFGIGCPEEDCQVCRSYRHHHHLGCGDTECETCRNCPHCPGGHHENDLQETMMSYQQDTSAASMERFLDESLLHALDGRESAVQRYQSHNTE